MQSKINNNKEYIFYFYPNIIYHETTFVEIGSFNSEDMFIADYFISFSKLNLNIIVNEIISLKSIDEFFKNIK